MSIEWTEYENSRCRVAAINFDLLEFIGSYNPQLLSCRGFHRAAQFYLAQNFWYDSGH